MRAILIGGPRHLHEFGFAISVGCPPPVWYVPVLEPFAPSATLGNPDPKSHFPTHAYNLQPERPGGYAIYLSEDL